MWEQMLVYSKVRCGTMRRCTWSSPGADVNQQIFDVFPNETHRHWLRENSFCRFVFPSRFRNSRMHMWTHRSGRPLVFHSTFVLSCEMRNCWRTSVSWQFFCFFLFADWCTVCVRFMCRFACAISNSSKNKTYFNFIEILFRDHPHSFRGFLSPILATIDERWPDEMKCAACNR